MSTLKSIEGLLEKPVYMMTGEEYLELTHYALANSPTESPGRSCPGCGARLLRVYYLRADARATRRGRIQCRWRSPEGSDRLPYRPTDRLRCRQGPKASG